MSMRLTTADQWAKYAILLSRYVRQFNYRCYFVMWWLLFSHGMIPQYRYAINDIRSDSRTRYRFSLYLVYLDVLKWVADKCDVCVAMNNGEICFQSFYNHHSSNVHLPNEFSSSEITGRMCSRIVSVVETRYRHVSHHFTCVSTKSHEKKVVQLMWSKADLVEVERHVYERFICHNKYNIAICVSTNCQRLCEGIPVQRRCMWIKGCIQRMNNGDDMSSKCRRNGCCVYNDEKTQATATTAAIFITLRVQRNDCKFPDMIAACDFIQKYTQTLRYGVLAQWRILQCHCAKRSV